MGNSPKQEIVIATANLHKFSEIIRILDYPALSVLSLRDFPDISGVEETGKSFHENALLKARPVYQRTGLITLADDSGLEVDALGGAPGIYSARFAGRSRDYDANNQKLLAELKSVPHEQRGAQFRCVVAIVSDLNEQVVEGIVRGHIIEEPRGEGGFGYDPLFVPDGFKRTYAELGVEIKNRISHRAIAFRKAAEVLKNLSTKKYSGGFE